jgi:hypothetical protein
MIFWKTLSQKINRTMAKINDNAEEKVEPICSFSKLKSKLSDMGIEVGEAVGYHPIEVADVDINDLKHNIEFKDDGIYLKDENGHANQRIFLYKRNYHLEVYGKPRFHIRKCSTIQSFIDSGSFKAEYRRANSESVPVRNIDDRYREMMIEDLPLCKNCLSMVGEAYKGMTTSDFVEILKQAEESSESNKDSTEVDIFGYVKGWEEISTAYRSLRNYTCERCGIQITNPFDYHYMHTHHRNGDKTDNKQSNLECLCIRCHSEVDENHREKLTRSANRVILEEFNEKYHKQ